MSTTDKMQIVRSDRDISCTILGGPLQMQWASVGIIDDGVTPLVSAYCSIGAAPILLAGMRLARDNRWINREQYIMIRTILVWQIRRANESIRTVRTLLTRAESRIELLTPRIHGPTTISIVSVRWRQRA